MASPMGMYTQASAEREYRWIFALTMPAFVLVALVSRLAPRTSARRHREGVLDEARAIAHTVIPYVFVH